MRDKILAAFLLTVTLSFVVANTLIIKKEIEKVEDSVRALDIREGNSKDAIDAYEIFKKKETYISMTVNHYDLTNIEESFAELIGYLSVGDYDGAAVTKSRLLDALSHLRRLTGFNIDSII